ncbi:Response regulatory domain-containing protein [Mycena indigotica]|uniref:Response regulatory domain-containing protein n=1 Tax=Mycena indigotica TaxID=2126181 RepID=A0A8H6S9K1_9AGAR|nr:Response regulatory domain-containing protein [Mycena indigotica]KAF7294641.1 Response regulatory domain-containing protein [Mycena indigotica]
MDERYRTQQPLLPLLSIAASRAQYSPTQQWASTSQTQLPVKRENGSPEQMERKESHEDSMSSTSDFVKKLYKMLEDQAFSSVVSWGPQGDCFVVKDMNEFTKSILPRMFKHSNFASFVRQLNKYDFHKVKNTDDNQFGEHSWTFRHPDFRADRRDALENIKRKVPAQRKSTSSAASSIPMPSTSSYQPTPGYPQPGPSSSFGANPYEQNAKVDAVQSQVASLQAQLSSLSAAHEEVLSHVRNLERSYQEVLVEMVGFQRGMAQQDGLMQNLIQYFLRENNGNGAGKMKQLDTGLDGLDGLGNPFLFMQTPEAQRMLDKSYPESDVARASLMQMSEISRRAEAVGMSFGGQSSVPSSSSSRLGSGVGASGIGAAMSRMDMLARIEELQAQRGKRINTPLPNFNSTNNPPELGGSQTDSPESEDFEEEVVQPTPTNPPNLDMSITPPSPPDPWALSAGDQHAGLEVYTVGHLMPRGSTGFPGLQGNWGFDTSPSTPELVGKQESQAGPSNFSNSGSGSPPSQKQTLRVRRSTFVPGWAVPPRVLLVDDDAVSRKLSSKFLQVFGCAIDVAVDGVGAVNKMNLEKYDLVLMDIIMPKLDGVSATSMIRKFDPQTPIISMTSNSRPNEIMTYYSSGMNDILPKPFTKEGLFEMLEKHLVHLTVIKEKMSTSVRIPRQPSGIPPLNDAGFEGALQAGAASMSSSSSSPSLTNYNFGLSSPELNDGRINVLAGMGLSDEQYNIMLAGIVNGDGITFGSSEKRSLELGDGDPDGPEGKRSRFEVVE